MSIKDFLMNKTKQTEQSQMVDKKPECKDNESVLTVHDQFSKAETLWALKTVIENFSFGASDGSCELFHKKTSRTKVACMICYGLGPYFLWKTIDDILRSPNPYYTIHIDKAATAQVKKHMDVFVRYFSYTDGKVKVTFLKALVFGFAFAETVADKKLQGHFKRQLVGTGSCELHIVHNTFRKGIEA